MTNIKISIAFIAMLLTSIQLFSQEKSVLFLGNSYTYYNDGLPNVFKQIASSMGKEVVVESNAPGGYTFEGHSTNTTSLDLIASRQWDFVVLQEQSQLPSFPPVQVEEEVYPFAEILCDSIFNNNPCTRTLFFMTWGRKNGDAANCPFYTPLCTYLGMQWRLRQSYVEMAEDNDGWAVPVGMVFKSVIESNPEIELYSGDESHPSVWGTYLAACTFYVSIFHENCIGAYKPESITEGDALILQNAAWDVVTDSLDIWLIDTTTVRSDFEPMYLTKSIIGAYANYSENADSCLWDFGDGSFEMQYPYFGTNFDMILHNYASTGFYDVCLTAYKDCSYEITCHNCEVLISGIETESQDEFLIFPNPVKDHKLNIRNATGKICRIINSEGKTVSEIKLTSSSIDISNLKPGVYILQIDQNSKQFVVE